MAKKNFKAIGSSILKDILDSPAPGPRKSEPAQLHNSDEYEDVRLHVYISQELEDHLLDEVYRRKRNKNIPMNQASKRAVVGDALESFFK